MASRVEIVRQNLVTLLQSLTPAERQRRGSDPLVPGSSLTVETALQLFEDQLLSRALDAISRDLKQQDKSFYTISSAGHEQNAVVGELLRADDPCFLHYRSGGFMMAHLRKDPERDRIMDTLLSFCAAADEPVSGGRHKVWGSRNLWIPPQTSTIASHLPKAVGLAFFLSRARKMGVPIEPAKDAIVCCSFGDASVNHATALAGVNSARYAFRRGHPTPVLFLCEDNKRGISVETPSRWVEDLFSPMRHMRYFRAEGSLAQVWEIAELAVRVCRTTRGPVFLHMPCVRLWGHAGSDVETLYRSLEEIEEVESTDPLLSNARELVETGAALPETLLSMVQKTDEAVHAAAEHAIRQAHLEQRDVVMDPIFQYDESRTERSASAVIDDDARRKVFGDELPEKTSGLTKRTMASHINSALADELLKRPEICLFGEDVGKKGGVYHVTKDLQQKFGQPRVFDTLLDETTILGLAQGAGHIGLLPIPEIQYLAYVHNAIDQLRGEACSLSFFSDGQFTNPMVIRIASFAYQKGFGGHFHNDNAIGALRDIPGLMLVTPSRGDDAARLLRGAVALARENGRIVCFLEPIALYHEKDLHEPGDRGWLFDYPAPGESLLPGDVGVYHKQSTDLLIASYANGLRMSLRAARRLQEDGIHARVVDLRWLNPLPIEAVRTHLEDCGSLLVVDECRATGGGIADALISAIAEAGFRGHLSSVRAADSYVPLGPAASTVLVQEEEIVDAARRLRA